MVAWLGLFSVLALVVVVPTAVKLGSLAAATDAGSVLPVFEYYRRRLFVTSLVATALALLSLLTGVVL